MLPLPRLRTVRLDRLMSRDELAKASGVSIPTIHRLEVDGEQAQFRTIRKLAQALGVEPAVLIGAVPSEVRNA
jgi:transcriptional regulator with XRE-family HTH domain